MKGIRSDLYVNLHIWNFPAIESAVVVNERPPTGINIAGQDTAVF